MKKIICALLALSLILSCLLISGCGSTQDDGKISIVTTIFPEYDWVRQILGDEIENADITMLLDSGVDLHNYRPTAEDIVTLARCDMFIYVGGHSDEWVDDVLAQANNKDMIAINLFELLGDAVKEDEHHEEDDHGDHDHSHVHEDDEHVWLSVCNAKTVCREIAEKLGQIDPENKEKYEANYTSYSAKLDAVDSAYRAAVESAPNKTLLFGDRFPFRYLTDEYGLEYYAAFSGCSAESEASFETIAYLAGKVDELGLSAVIKIEGSDGKIAETIINTTSEKTAKILTLNSMQSLTPDDAEDGVSYISVMESNLEVIKEALR